MFILDFDHILYFYGPKIIYILQRHFLDTLFSSFSTFLISLSVVLDSLWVTDYGMMCHYPGRIRILWPMLRGAMLDESIQESLDEFIEESLDEFIEESVDEFIKESLDELIDESLDEFFERT